MKNKKIIEFFIVLIAIFLLLNKVEAFNESNISTIDTTNFITSDPIEIQSDQDFVDLGFSGSGTKEDPYIIENYEINATNVEDGISVEDTTKYFIIRGCKITGANHGISIENVTSETAQIINNYCYVNDENGIDLYRTSGHIIANNTLIENKSGIRFDECSNLIIIHNTCNKQYAAGIISFNSDNLNITGNTIGFSDYKGMAFETTQNSVIYKNLLEFNDEFGILITWSCTDNVVYHNDFIDNNQDPTINVDMPQADDAGENNLWYNSAILEGNYWSDYSGEGAYQISGSAFSYDLYPLGEPIIEDTNYSLLFILALLSTSFVVIKRRKRN